MSAGNPAAAELIPASSGRADVLINRARAVVTVLVASMAMSAVGAVIETSFASAADPETPSTLLRHGGGKPGEVQEYVRVVSSDAGGEARPTDKNTLVFTEKCKDNGKKVSRTVTYNMPNQPLGKCDIGSKVTVTEEESLKDGWTHQSKPVQTVAKATRKNNHNFVFIEQATGTSSTPFTISPAPPTTAPSAPAPTEPEPADPYAPGNVGVDISWPQCGTPNETPSGFDFGIVGVNNGLGYSTNPCLRSEAANFAGKKLNLYVNTGWNSNSIHINPNSPRACAEDDEICLAYNFGYNAGAYAINAATTAGLSVNVRWWKDVEDNATWSTNTAENAASLEGETDALIDGGATEVGDYSTTVQWNEITGDVQNGEVSWGATTWTTAADARTYCTGHQFTGGPSKLMQFLPSSELDEDVAC